MSTYKDVLTLNQTATAPITGYTCVNFNGATAGADGLCAGIAMTDQVAGKEFTYLAIGTIRMPSAGGIAKGDLINSDAQGRAAKAAPAAVNVFARALTAAVNPGDFVEILIK